MTTEKKKKTTKDILLRLPFGLYPMLVREAAALSIERGETVTVPRLCLEIIEGWLESKKK